MMMMMKRKRKDLLQSVESIHFLVVEVFLYFFVLIVLIPFFSLSIVHYNHEHVVPNHSHLMSLFLNDKYSLSPPPSLSLLSIIT